MSATLINVMDGLAGLMALAPNVYAWPPESITIPALIIGYPTRIDYDLTYGDIANTWTIPAWYVVGTLTAETSRAGLSAAITGIGSVKATLDGVQSFGVVRVTDASVEEIGVSGISYIGVKYTIEVNR